jgi:paired amphipathic helix protein Sin3a
VEDYYPAFLDMVKNVLDGNMDSNAYEDTLREMFGIHAYIAFTLDKVVANAVRQLQQLVVDESSQECFDMYLDEKKKGATGGACSKAAQNAHTEMAYQKRAEQALSDENCYKLYIVSRNKLIL